MRLAVTGANSSIGERVCAEISAIGNEPLRLIRRPRDDDRHFDLAADLDPRLLDGVDAVIHLAWAWLRPGAEYRRTNVEGSRRLFDAAAARGIPVVLLSTFSAFAQGRSEYADCKRALEYDLRGGSGAIVRAGLIWGDKPAGMIKTVISMASTPGACFHLIPDPVLYQTEIGMLAQLLVSVAIGDASRSQIWAAWPESLTLSTIAHAVRTKPPAIHVRVPTAAIRAVARFAELAHVQSPVRSDSFAGTLRTGDVPAAGSGRSRFADDFAGNAEFLSWLRKQSGFVSRSG